MTPDGGEQELKMIRVQRNHGKRFRSEIAGVGFNKAVLLN